MAQQIRDIDRGYKALKARIEKATKEKTWVDVGVMGEENEAPREDGLTNVLIGGVHEFGSTTRNIPERSWNRATVDENRNKYRNAAKKFAKQVKEGLITKRVALERFGALIVADMQARIRAGIQPDIQERTKKRKGSSGILIDTGEFLNSISWKVRP